MKATIDYIMDPSVDTAVFHILNPFEGTDIYEEVKKEGIDPSVFRDKYEYISPNFSSSSRVTVEELKEIYFDGVRGFFNFNRIITSYDKWKKFHKPS